MMSLEEIQDLCNSGCAKFYGLAEPDFPQEHIELFDEFKIDDKHRLVLSTLINNFNSQYMVKQEEEGHDVALIRKMSVMELLYYYTNCLSFVDIIDVQPMVAPASLVYSNGESHAVAAKTIKANGIGELFSDLEEEISKELFSSLDEPENISLSCVKEYLDNNDYFNYVAYNSFVVLDSHSFEPMISNGAIVRAFEIKQEKVEVKGFIPVDEILLKKQNSRLDIGFAFCPYIIPMRAATVSDGIHLKDSVMARYGFYRNDVNKFFKRIKIVK